MKTVLGYVAAATLGFALVFVVAVGLRKFSQATTPVAIVEPEPGTHCALAVTSDGVAIDCWAVQP